MFGIGSNFKLDGQIKQLDVAGFVALFSANQEIGTIG